MHSRRLPSGAARFATTTVLLLLTLSSRSSAWITLPPPTKRPKPSPTVPPPLVQSFYPIIRNGSKRVHTRAFATLPNFRGKPMRIVGITAFGNALYVTTSTSGALIYRVTMRGAVRLFFDVQKSVLASTGRNIDCISGKHGGVRGVAFPPDFARTGLFYVSFLEQKPANPTGFRYFSGPYRGKTPDSVVAEFKYNSTSRKVGRLSYRQVIRIGNPQYDHPIKQIAFDGKFLLIGHGDGSIGSRPLNGGMDNDGLGKILKINPKRRGARPYSIPSDNPFIGNPRFKNELYAIGLRNPHNICVSKRHGIFVTDAGRDNVEEINIIKPGGNYGWKQREGTFVHLDVGGTLTGIKNLPWNDSRNGYIYPNVQLPHWAPVGQAIFGQALAGSCPIENGSPLKGLFLYANFAAIGELFYSFVGSMKKAVTTGTPRELRKKQAIVYIAKVHFDHDNNPATPPLVLNNMRDVVINDGFPRATRVDLRFGRGPQGQIFWSSKISGKIYLITSSVRGALI